MDINRLLADRARAIDASGIRRVFELGSKLKNPCNLSIGQPDFPAPDAVKRAAIDAIAADRNGYTLTQGVAELRSRIERALGVDLGWDLAPGSGASVLVTSGTSGALLLACFALLGPGDEIVIPDPWFVLYPHLATLCGARAVPCATGPDGRMTAQRVEPLLTGRTKIVLFNSPANPTGVVATRDECADLLDLCRRRGVLLISDEIYDEFCYSESRTDRFAGDAGRACCPSPARFEGAQEDVLVVRGFGKTYGVTGWRMGYAAGPTALVEQMAKFQQYTFVCAPAPLQWGCAAALDADMSGHVSEYESRRDLVVDRLREVTDLPFPGGAFYAFPRVPARLGLSGSRLVERAVERSVLVIPGAVFSSRDEHFRLGFATSREQLERGLDEIVGLLRG